MLAYVAECRLLQLAIYTTKDVMYQFTYHVYEMAKYRLFINTYIHNTYCENVRVTLPSPNVSIKQLFLNATSCQGRSWINCYCSAWWATFGEKRSILRKRHCFPQGWNHWVAYWLRSHWSEIFFQKMLNLAFDVIIIHIDQGHWWVYSLICTTQIVYCIFFHLLPNV